MLCPSCYEEMIHSDTKDIEEGVFVAEYCCHDCRVTVEQYYGEKVEDFW